MNFIIKALACLGVLFTVMFLYYFFQEPKQDTEVTNRLPTVNEADFKNNFMSGCNSDGTLYAYCACAYSELRSDYNIEEFVSLYSKGLVNEALLSKYALICSYQR